MGNLLERLFKKRGRDGQLELKGEDLTEMLRQMLEEQGVPKEELKNADLFDLLKKLREKDGNKGLFPGLEEMGDMLRFQSDPKVAEKLNNHFKELLDGSRPGAAKASPSTFHLRDGKKLGDMVALATAVKADGWLLTKASEVEKLGRLECEVKGTWLPAKVDRVWKEHDLALIKIEAMDLPAVQWTTPPALIVGTFVTAVAPEGEDPLALGVVSVATRNLQNKGRGYLGVRLASDDKGLKIDLVVPDGAAKGAGVQKEDRILELDGQKPDSAYTFTKMVSERKAGDKVKLKLQRGNEVVEKEIQLGDRASLGNDSRPGFDKMSALGSTVNKRKDDFASIVQTDLPIDANQCGGPVTDLDGNVIGIMIARSGRIESLMVPSATIREVLSAVDALKK
jgi:S1-C subfamily serine protease